VSVAVALIVVGHGTLASAQTSFGLPLDGMAGDAVRVFGGPPNMTVTYSVTHTNAAVLGLSLSTTGPWSESLTVSVTLNASGNGVSQVFYVLGEELGASQVNGCPIGVTPPCGTSTQVDYTVVSVANVELLAIDSPLDSNPNAGGGLRVFPDKVSPSDSANRRRVRIRATLTAAVPDISVYFRSFDFDDPSTDATAVDSNGSSPNDNRGSPRNGTLYSGSSSTTGILGTFSNSSGLAEVELEVTLHPGDNFGVAVAVRGAVISGISVGASGTSLVDGSGNSLPTVRGKATQMLTVWRRLHIEVDSMAAVTGNMAQGLMTSSVPNPLLNRSDVVVNTALDFRRFEGGVLAIPGVGIFPVLINGINNIGVQGLVPTSASGLPFVLVDDDDFNSDDSTAKDGDDAEDVDSLTTTFSLMQDSDDPAANAFAPAYIRPIYDGGGNTSNDSGRVPFVLNVASGSVETQINLGHDSEAAEGNDFWVVYMQVGYQGRPDADEDPNGEGATGGTSVTYATGHTATSEATVPRGGPGSLVYMETMRDFGLLFPTTAAPHEVGHQMGLADAPTGFGIMSAENTMFVDSHINVLRWRVKSPGQP
jgi:hypothetical protein